MQAETVYNVIQSLSETEKKRLYAKKPANAVNNKKHINKKIVMEVNFNVNLTAEEQQNFKEVVNGLNSLGFAQEEMGAPKCCTAKEAQKQPNRTVFEDLKEQEIADEITLFERKMVKYLKSKIDELNASKFKNHKELKKFQLDTILPFENLMRSIHYSAETFNIYVKLKK